MRQVNSTLLTGETPEQKRLRDEQEAKRQLHVERVRVFCECMVESLEDRSVTYQQAVENIVKITTTCLSKGFITKATAERFTGHYVIECAPYVGITKHEGRSGLPSGVRKLIRDNWSGLERYGYKTTENSSGEVSRKEYISKLLAEYGVEATESQVIKNAYKK